MKGWSRTPDQASSESLQCCHCKELLLHQLELWPFTLFNLVLACLLDQPPCLLQERERMRTLEQKKGAIKILDQLAERERERAATDDARRREGDEMKARIQALREEEQKVRRKSEGG